MMKKKQKIRILTVACLSTLFPVSTGGGFFFIAESGTPFGCFFPGSAPASAAATSAASNSASFVISRLSDKPR
jgi:hypothetical protein